MTSSAAKPICASIVLFASAFAAAQASAWDSLKTLRNNYTVPVYEKNGTCHAGRIIGVSPTGIVLTWNEIAGRQQVARTATIPRADVLSIGTGHDIAYSGRSSWLDVQSAKPDHAESLEVTLISGKKYNGADVSSSSDELVLSSGMTKRKLLKSAIQTVVYARQRPITDYREWLVQEEAWAEIFDPDLWVRASGLSSKLRVPLYEAGAPEDDRPLGLCR